MKKTLAIFSVLLVWNMVALAQATNPMINDGPLSSEEFWKGIALAEPLIFLTFFALIDGRARTREETRKARR